MSSYPTPTPRMDQGSAASSFSFFNLLAGIWLIISPFIVGYASFQAPMWNSVIVGAVVLILSAIRMANPLDNAGLSWVNFILGIWTIITPWALVSAMRPLSLCWNDVIVGIIVALLGIGSAMSTQATGYPVRR